MALTYALESLKVLDVYGICFLIGMQYTLVIIGVLSLILRDIPLTINHRAINY